MSNFKLEYSVEYNQIKERRRLAKSALNASGDYAASLAGIAASTIKQLTSEKLPHDNAIELLSRRNELFAKVVTTESLDQIVTEVGSCVAKNPVNICNISNYSCAEYLFWIECESADLKKYRTGTGTEDSNIRLARTIRRRGEECYKAGSINEAIKIFKEADEKYPGDFTVHYQLGLIYFFEKPDFPIALEYFRKASKYSQNKSKQVFINSMVFTGLLLRLAGQASNDANMLNEAYQAIVQAYNSDPSYIFSIYSLVQANTFINGGASKKDSLNLLKDLIKREKYFTLQIIYDRAFDHIMDDIEGLYDSLLGDATNLAAQMFEKIDEALAELSKSVKFMTIPAKLTNIKKEYEEIKKLIDKKNCFDVIIANDRATAVLNSINDFLAEVKKNKAYFEVRDLIETLAKRFSEEFKDAVKSFSKVEEKCNELKSSLAEINKNYPIAEPEKTIKKKNSDVEEIIPAAPGWRFGRMFLAIKFISGCFAFTFVCALIFAVYLFMGFEMNWVPFVLGILNMCFIPIYGSIFAEIYYVMTENRRKNIQNSVTKLEKKIELNKTQVNEIDKGLRDKYANMVIDQIKVSKFTAAQMLDAGIDGSFEKIKTLMP